MISWRISTCRQTTLINQFFYFVKLSNYHHSIATTIVEILYFQWHEKPTTTGCTSNDYYEINVFTINVYNKYGLKTNTFRAIYSVHKNMFIFYVNLDKYKDFGRGKIFDLLTVFVIGVQIGLRSFPKHSTKNTRTIHFEKKHLNHKLFAFRCMCRLQTITMKPTQTPRSGSNSSKVSVALFQTVNFIIIIIVRGTICGSKIELCLF